jgi:hypothetical protein
MNNLPGWHNVRPDPQDEESIETCYTHGDFDGVGSCPYCARIDTLKIAAISGLESQLQRLNKHNAVDMQDLTADIKRALNYLRLHG